MAFYILGASELLDVMADTLVCRLSIVNDLVRMADTWLAFVLVNLNIWVLRLSTVETHLKTYVSWLIHCFLAL